MKKSRVFIIYVGTTKLAAFDGVIAGDTLTVEHFAKVPSTGFNRGLVVDIERASLQIRELLKNVEGNCDPSKCDFFVVLSNDRIKSYSSVSSLYFGDATKTITHTDITKVIDQTRTVATIPLNEYIIDSLPQEFIVNDLEGIINPLDLEARRLGVSLLLFTVDVGTIRNIEKAFERADVNVVQFIPKGLSSAHAILRDEEKRDGIVLVDIGGYVTDIIYFRNGVVQYYDIVPFGGESLSESLAEHVSVSVPEARRLKERFGSAVLVSAFEDEIIPVVDIFGKTKLSLNKKRLYDHLFVSSKDLLERIKPALEKVVKRAGSVPGVVLTGGTAGLDGFLELSQDVFALPVRAGITRRIRGPKEIIMSPKYGAAVGGLGYVADRYKQEAERYSGKPFFIRQTMQVKEWIQEYF